jgi:NTE family protein
MSSASSTSTFLAPLTGASTSPDGLAVPRDFGARRGDGLHLGLSLGGGGIFFVAWQVTYLRELLTRGIDLSGAQRIVGTSAGSMTAAVLQNDAIGRFDKQLSVMARVPALVAKLAPASEFSPSQQRALDLFGTATDATTETLRSIGGAALAAATPAPSVMERNAGLIILSRKWRSPALHITCVDTYTGERCVITRDAQVPIARAVAASSAIPGVFSPQPIGDRRCMDGGVSGSGTHLDLFAGAERVVVLSLIDGSPTEVGGMTQAPGAFHAEIEELRASGTELFLRSPETMDIARLMDPKAVPEAIAMARRQAAVDADALREFIA